MKGGTSDTINTLESVKVPQTTGHGAPLAMRDRASLPAWDGAPLTVRDRAPLPTQEVVLMPTRDAALPQTQENAPLPTWDAARQPTRTYTRPPAVPLIALNGSHFPVSALFRPMPTGALTDRFVP